MGYIATDIARIPAEGFEWYVFVLLDGWDDPFRNEIERNFDRLVEAVGPDCLVVRGAKTEGFYNQILNSQLMTLAADEYRKPPLPALIVSNRAPSNMDASTGVVSTEGAKVMIFPLSERYVKPGAVTNFLQKLAENIKNRSFDEIAEDADPKALKSKWRWITEYMELKPNFYGFGVNLNKILEEIFEKRQRE